MTDAEAAATDVSAPPAHDLTTFLTPTPTKPISRDQCMVAVALADQLGAALATQHGGPA
ncbi:MAG TPA: hypothetical protein VII96_07300 [Acidimicrobiales bacterium]